MINLDKNCVRQILGSLIQHPQFLSETDKYNLTIDDFQKIFDKYIFSAIVGLYAQGATSIDVIDINNYLESNQTAFSVFEKNNGIEFLQDTINFSDIESFPYYYTKLKKINLLRQLERDGFDVSLFYCEDLTKKNALEINSQFEELTIQDIIDSVKQRIFKAEHNYVQSEAVQIENPADDIDDFLENMVDEIDIGLPLQGKIYNEVVSGARLGTLYIRSLVSGGGKTRNAVGDACQLAYPIRWDISNYCWTQIGSNEKVLFIATEQSFKEIKKMMIAYLTGIDEEKFKQNIFTAEEKLRISQAAQIMKDYKDNFIIARVPDPSIEVVKSVVRENCLLHQIRYVFYDYIFISNGLLKEFKGTNLRNDELLLQFATALKDLSVEQNIFISTSTQVNANADDNSKIRDESSLAGGRATINKADVGVIGARPTKEELQTLGDLIVKYGEPNIVFDIFKNRGGKWTQIRIWSYQDLGTMRKKDLFVTDSRLYTIDGFDYEFDYNIKTWDEDVDEILYKRVTEMNKAIEAVIGSVNINISQSIVQFRKD